MSARRGRSFFPNLSPILLLIRCRSLLVHDMSKVIVLSPDEAKQHFVRLEFQHKHTATDEVIYHNLEQVLGVCPEAS